MLELNMTDEFIQKSLNLSQKKKRGGAIICRTVMAHL